MKSSLGVRPRVWAGERAGTEDAAANVRVCIVRSTLKKECRHDRVLFTELILQLF